MAEDQLKRAVIIGVAGDPGGSRALLPVFDHLYKSGIPFEIFNHGYLGREAPSHWQKIPASSRNTESVAHAFDKRNIRALVFASSIKDDFPLLVARKAKQEKIPVVHVLDHWTNYLNRLQTGGQAPVFPDIYTVIDQKAYDQAAEEGIPVSSLRIVGQPSFASLLEENHAHMMNSDSLDYFRDPENEKMFIIFVSEPVSSDQGDSPLAPHYRGYNEKEVLTLLCDLIQPFESKVRLGILPHPRENAEELGTVFNNKKGKLEGELIERSDGRRSVHMAKGIIGMASILLYEAWLLGKPVISLQPGLIKKELAFMKDRDGCLFIDGRGDMKNNLKQWINKLESIPDKNYLRKDLHVHTMAAAKICEIILNL